jgi:two-component system, CitB family, sensor histidine kinase MalK
MNKNLHFTLKLKTVFLVLLINVIFVLTVGGITSYQVAQNQKHQIKSEISSVAQIISESLPVKSVLANNAYPGKNNYIQKYAKQIQQAEKVDFIVVLNQKYIRYSHPNQSRIGKPFSSIQDAQKSNSGKIHFSHRKGILGTGYRIFKPIYYQHNQIGMVCVGLTDKSINKAILESQKSVILASTLALISSIILAIYLAQKIKKSLFNMEPDEIATKLTELYAINDSIDEILIAINNQNIVITANTLALKNFPSIKIGTLFDPTLTQLIFKQRSSSRLQVNEPLLINAKEFVVSTSQLIYQDHSYGQIALLQDQSKYQKLAEKLAGSEQYIQSLRAQSHEFLNKLQAIYGMIELTQYDKVTSFISQVHQSYQQEFGQLNQQIESPVLVGFLTGKINQANEQRILLQITPESYLPRTIVTDQLNLDLIKIWGNLIDNALTSIKNTGKITLSVNYDTESYRLITEVTDTGSGITPEVKKLLFKQKYSTKGIDHGYGLMLVNQIVTEHQGFIEINSQLPHGSAFYIELPVNYKE